MGVGCMATVNPRDVDAAKYDKDDPRLMMLGAYSRNPCFHISEVDVRLNHVYTKRVRDHKPVSEDMKKTLQYCKRFRPLKNDPAAMKAKEQLLRKVEVQD